jgi:hypothetical protein
MSNFLNRLMLCAFLLPFSAQGDSCDEHRDEYMEILLKISAMGKAITEKDEYIQSLKSEMTDIIIKLMQSKNLKEEEDFLEFGKAIDRSHIAFMAALNEALAKQNVEGFLLKELCKENEFETLKFYMVRMNSEYLILKDLMSQYEKLQQERFNIDPQSL